MLEKQASAQAVETAPQSANSGGSGAFDLLGLVALMGLLGLRTSNTLSYEYNRMH